MRYNQRLILNWWFLSFNCFCSATPVLSMKTNDEKLPQFNKTKTIFPIICPLRKIFNQCLLTAWKSLIQTTGALIKAFCFGDFTHAQRDSKAFVFVSSHNSSCENWPKSSQTWDGVRVVNGLLVQKLWLQWQHCLLHNKTLRAEQWFQDLPTILTMVQPCSPF